MLRFFYLHKKQHSKGFEVLIQYFYFKKVSKKFQKLKITFYLWVSLTKNNKFFMTATNQLEQLVATLEAQSKLKRDTIVSGSGLVYGDGKLWVRGGLTGYAPTEYCHGQIATKLNIPKKYYDRMLSENPELLNHNINMWLAKDKEAKYLLRMFGFEGGEVAVARAFLSDGFNIIDNFDVLNTALRAIKDMGVKVRVEKATVSEKRMYLHITCPEVEVEAQQLLKDYLRDTGTGAGNGVMSGLIICNSEVGCGSFEIRPRAVIIKCNNGLIGTDSYRRVHLGQKMNEGDIVWSERTQQANMRLILNQTQDAVRHFLSPDYVGKMVANISHAHEIKLENPIDTVQHVCHELEIAEAFKRDVLKYFVEDGDSTASGVFHAVTRAAQGMNADAQFDVEKGAYELLPKIKKFDKTFKN
jgi:hypothetical protein